VFPDYLQAVVLQLLKIALASSWHLPLCKIFLGARASVKRGGNYFSFNSALAAVALLDAALPLAAVALLDEARCLNYCY
jgi:hypothetical protein